MSQLAELLYFGRCIADHVSDLNLWYNFKFREECLKEYILPLGYSVY